MKRGNIIISIVILIFVSTIVFVVSNLKSGDVEWFTGNDWKKRTKEIKLHLKKLPQGYRYNLNRYESSDFLKVWGPNEEYINFGSVVPKDFIELDCVRGIQIGELTMRCDSSFKRDDLAVSCLSSILEMPRQALNIHTIVANYTIIEREIKKLPSSYNEDNGIKGGKKCWASRDNDIPSRD